METTLKPSRIALLLALAASFAASPLCAQDRTGTIEITPFGGGYIGGRLHAGSNSIFSRSVDIKPSAGYGLRLAANVNRWFALEAGFSRAESDIKGTGSGLFGGGQKLGEMEFRHYELNGVFNFGKRRVIPYVTLGGGATTFRARVPEIPTTADTRFTANFGLGVKFFVHPHVALRFDGRGRAAYVNDSRRCERLTYYYCDGHDYRDDDSRRWYGSGEVTGGLTFAF